MFTLQQPIVTVYTATIKIVGDLRQIGGFLRVFRFPSPIKMTATI